MDFLVYFIVMFATFKEVNGLNQIYFCPEENTTIYCNVSNEFTRLYWKNSTDHVVASVILDKARNKTYKPSERFYAIGLSLRIAFPKDGEHVYCNAISSQKEKIQRFILVKYSEPFPDGVSCNSPTVPNSRQPEDTHQLKIQNQKSDQQYSQQKIIKNDTRLVCIHGSVTLECGDTNGIEALYWKDAAGKTVASIVREQILNGSNTRFVFNTDLSLLVRNLSKDDDFFTCERIYPREECINRIKLVEYGIPEESGFLGFENKSCEVHSNKSGHVELTFRVGSFSPMNAINVSCECNGRSIPLTPQYLSTYDGYVLQIPIHKKIESSQNVTCTVSGAAMCNREKRFDCKFKHKIKTGWSDGQIAAAVLIPLIIIMGISYYVYRNCCVEKNIVGPKSGDERDGRL